MFFGPLNCGKLGLIAGVGACRMAKPSCAACNSILVGGDLINNDVVRMRAVAGYATDRLIAINFLKLDVALRL
jgi:hypothetical protein